MNSDYKIKIEPKARFKTKVKSLKHKCNSCGGKAGLSENGFCVNCNRTKSQECESCGSVGIEKEGYLCKYCVDDAIVYK